MVHDGTAETNLADKIFVAGPLRTMFEKVQAVARQESMRFV